MSFSAADACYMARALKLATRGLYTTDPNPRVGCVIVKNGTVVGEGWHVCAGQPHAEALALQQAGGRARGADVYVTLEPCDHFGRTPPCADALVRAGVRRVVAAMRDPNHLTDGKGFETLRGAGIEVSTGLLEDRAQALNPGFVSRLTRGRPYVRLKVGASLDGRTALASGESRWITGEAARADVQTLRARSSAVITGIGTVLADDPELTVRAFDIGRQPLRVVADSNLRTPAQAKILRRPGRALIVTTSGDSHRADTLVAAGAEVARLRGGKGGVNLAQLLSFLAKFEVNEVLVEAGASLAGAFLTAGLVDELVIYFAPAFLGDAGRGMFRLPMIAALAQRLEVTITDTRAVGDDWRITARIGAE